MATRVTYDRTRLELKGDGEVPSVLAIVVTHRGRAWIRDSLVALNAQHYSMLDVLVVDDASPDSRAQPPLRRIAKRHLKGRRWGYVRTPRPLGFGGAINWALSRVRTDADLLLFLHDDAVLDPLALGWMIVRLLGDDTTAIVGPKVVSWDDPNRLEEVGMAVDRLGYPYKGLEEGEIDLGQHDHATEVFYVTSTCMLVRHEIFRRLRGWDARLRAFAEDLDLCWRARVAGYEVRVEPQAKARHLMGLATGKRESPFTPTKYFIRRNRLRALAKNATGARLVALFPLFVLLTLAEMVGFAFVRQPREIWNLTRALGWNLITLPQTLSERARVQRIRKVPDRKLRRLTVRETTRVHSYIGHQADRLEEAWGRRAELLARRGQEAKLLGSRLKGWPIVVAVAALILFVFAFRNMFLAPPAAVGELLPYPDRATALWRAFLSPWRAVGLGQPGPSLPAFAILGVFPIVALGAVDLAQKLLLLGLGIAAFWGASLLVGELVDKPSRYAAGAAYALGALGYAGVRNGALGALVFGAAAPFVLLSMIRLIGWVRPPNWNRGRTVARTILGAAISAAFVPGSLVLYFVMAVLLTATRTFLDRGSKPLRGLLASLVGLTFGWVLLLPWSATWFDRGEPFDRLTGATTWRLHAAGFADDGVASVLLGQTPEFPILAGLALPLLGIIAVAVGIGQRRRLAVALWAVIAADAWLVAAVSNGTLRPFVASPIEAAVPAALAFAGLVGLAVGAFRLDLPRRGLGVVHALTLGGIAVALFLVTAGLGPALVRGDWAPGRGTDRVAPESISQIRDVLEIEAELEGQFRALWVGEGWSAPQPSVARPNADYMITGPRGQVLSDLFESQQEKAEEELARVVASIREGATDRGGSLLGAFNVRFVVLERGPGTHRWLAQRDLALVRLEGDYLMLENQDRLSRAAVYPDVPPHIAALAQGDVTLSVGDLATERFEAEQRSASHYVAEDATAPGVAVLTEANHRDWAAFLEGQELESVDAGWANAFELPSEAAGRLTIEFPRSRLHTVWLLIVIFVWIVVGGGAFGRTSRSEPPVRR